MNICIPSNSVTIEAVFFVPTSDSCASLTELIVSYVCFSQILCGITQEAAASVLQYYTLRDRPWAGAATVNGLGDTRGTERAQPGGGKAITRMAFGGYAWCLLQPNNPRRLSLGSKNVAQPFAKNIFDASPKTYYPVTGWHCCRFLMEKLFENLRCPHPLLLQKSLPFFCERDTSRSNTLLLVNVHPRSTITFLLLSVYIGRQGVSNIFYQSNR
jgi:hypothetical protein